MLSHVLAAGTLVASGLACVSRISTGTPPCDALTDAGLRSHLLFPTDAGYEPQIESWMSRSARLRPWCLFLPQNTKEVASAMETLSNSGNGAGNWHIAIRSGGVSAIGGNNIANGVTIDLSMMNSTRYDRDSNIAMLEPGARWSKAFADLEAEGVVVVGGRDANVGVGGFFLGGGTSFFSGTKGFGCDNVVNYEVVLPNGNVVNANETFNPDLWRALKGGGSNFGVVTRFDVAAMPTRKILYNLRYIPMNYSSAVIDTIIDFAGHNESMGENALVVLYLYEPLMGDVPVIGVIHVNTAGDVDARTSFDNIQQLPRLVNITRLQTMAESAATSNLGRGGWYAGVTLTFRDDPAILHYAAEVFNEYMQLLKQSVGAGNFMATSILQPIPLHYGQIGLRTGGNMLGLDNLKHPAVMWSAGVEVRSNEAAFAVAQAELNSVLAKINAFTDSVDGGVDLIYLNYAAANQDPLGSYPAEHIQFLRDVAAKYDPDGIFQRRVPGGFKISRVD